MTWPKKPVTGGGLGSRREAVGSVTGVAADSWQPRQAA